MKHIEWYFDFVSPFPYFQIERFDVLPQDVEVTLRPVLFAGLLNHWQTIGPAEIPGKRKFTYRYVQWLAQKQGLALKFPPTHPFNPIKALRLAIAIGDHHVEIKKIFRFIWRDGRSLDDAQAWIELCESVGVKNADARINDQRVKDELRGNGERAIAAGVFGVPSFVIDGEIFWGFDATGMVVDFLGNPALFESAEMVRVDNLPAGGDRLRK